MSKRINSPEDLKKLRDKYKAELEIRLLTKESHSKCTPVSTGDKKSSS